jgi:hypothetical protein
MHKRKILSQMFEMKGDSITCFSHDEAKNLRKEIHDIILERK